MVYNIYIQVHHLRHARARTLELVSTSTTTHARVLYIILNYVPDRNFQSD